MQAARDKLKSKLTPGKKKSESPKVVPEGYDTDEQEREYRRQRSAMAGPKHKIDEKDMQNINMSAELKNDNGQE